MQTGLPRAFGRYTLLKSLRQGAMGEAYLAASGEGSDASLCVVKLGLPELKPDLAARFPDEARMMLRLSFANVARVFDAGQIDGVRFYAMEYVDGWNLEEVAVLMKAAHLSMPVPVAVFIAREIARGLHFAHTADLQIIHRDVAPANVMLTMNGEVKLIDFGVARSNIRRGLTAPGEVLGHVAYFAPERFKDDYDHRTDLYSAGVILWEMLTGAPLFAWRLGHGEPEPPPGRGSIPAPSSRRPEVDPELDAIVLRALAESPAERFQDGEAMRAALGAYLARTAGETDCATVAAVLRDAAGDSLIQAQRRERAHLLALVAPPEEPTAADARTPLAGGAQARVGSVVVGKYRLDRLCGTGGMGDVYDGKHVAIGRRVAVKILKPEYRNSADVLERFSREAQLASRAGNDNIVQVTDSGVTADGCPFLVMEYLDGESLQQTLRREGVLPVGRAISIAVEIARGLEGAHAAGIVHRDLKPSNVMLLVDTADDGPKVARVKLLDFGVSKSLIPPKDGAVEQPLTRQLAPVGTPDYMSPEQTRGVPADFSSDVYALGGVLFEMLTGRTPFDADSPLVIMKAKRELEAPRARTLNPEIPSALDDLVARALAREKGDRPSSAVTFRAELEALARSLPGPGKTGVATAAKLARRARDLLVRRRVAVALVAVGCGVILAVVAGVGTGSEGKRLPPRVASTVGPAPQPPSAPPARSDFGTGREIERPAAAPRIKAPAAPAVARRTVEPSGSNRKVESAQKAGSQHPPPPDVPPLVQVTQESGRSLADSAADALKQKRYVRAIELGEAALAAHNDDLRTRLTLGKANLMLSRPNEATKHFAAAARLDPGNADAAAGLSAADRLK